MLSLVPWDYTLNFKRIKPQYGASHNIFRIVRWWWCAGYRCRIFRDALVLLRGFTMWLAVKRDFQHWDYAGGSILALCEMLANWIIFISLIARLWWNNIYKLCRVLSQIRIWYCTNKLKMLLTRDNKSLFLPRYFKREKEKKPAQTGNYTCANTEDNRQSDTHAGN